MEPNWQSILDVDRYQPILQQPDWYIVLADEIQEYFLSYTGSEKHPSEWHQYRRAFASMIAAQVESGTIALGDTGPDWDADRQSIDTIVIHHSSLEPEIPISYIDALGLLRLYVKQFLDPKNEYVGQPIYSGHIRNGIQTFVGYHYIITRAGEVYHMLDDTAIGWHAGQWEVNCRSIGICLHDDLADRLPSKEALAAAETLIASYPGVTVLPHNAINTQTTCPGSWYTTWQNKHIYATR